MGQTILAALLLLASGLSLAADLATATVQRTGGAAIYVSDGVVEAVRQSVMSSQVPGRVTGLTVKAGDHVRAGQVLARIDQQEAIQQAAASQAQVAAAESQLDAARKDLQRNQRLFAQHYISQAAMDRFEAQFKVAAAQARATLAEAGVARTQTGFHSLAAPYAGIVAAVPAEVGDMAMPGKAVLEIYDPGALRVVAHVPETIVAQLRRDAPVNIELSGKPDGSRTLVAKEMLVMPTANPSSHTVEIRLPLPVGTVGLSPGLFARVLLPLIAGDQRSRLTVPAQAVIKRTELTAVYVVDAQGTPRLRQVRLGRILGDRVEVLAGLAADERVALDPLAAARER
jgi:multidrug efflux system membrane fusion protein